MSCRHALLLTFFNSFNSYLTRAGSPSWRLFRRHALDAHCGRRPRTGMMRHLYVVCLGPWAVAYASLAFHASQPRLASLPLSWLGGDAAWIFSPRYLLAFKVKRRKRSPLLSLQSHPALHSPPMTANLLLAPQCHQPLAVGCALFVEHNSRAEARACFGKRRG